MTEAVKRRIRAVLAAAIVGVLAWVGGSIAWAELGPAGQRERAIDKCIDEHTDALFAQYGYSVESGEAADLIIERCNSGELQ